MISTPAPEPVMPSRSWMSLNHADSMVGLPGAPADAGPMPGMAHKRLCMYLCVLLIWLFYGAGAVTPALAHCCRCTISGCKTACRCTCAYCRSHRLQRIRSYIHTSDRQDQQQLSLTCCCGCNPQQSEAFLFTAKWCPPSVATTNIELPPFCSMAEIADLFWISISHRIPIPPG
jgi:hypothetical protein